MSEVLYNVKIISDQIASVYNLDLVVFFAVYLFSFLPFYFGYFLIIFGTTRRLDWKSVLSLKIKGNLQWNVTARNGLYLHLFGRILPYLYIVIWGRNLPWWLYAGIFVLAILSVYTFIKNILSGKNNVSNQILVRRDDEITDSQDVYRLWSIYSETFEPINKISPCRQSLDQGHFIEALRDTSVRKYLLVHKSSGIIGMALITNNFINTPWISEEYFKVSYPSEYKSSLIYYFMGLAIDSGYRGNKYSIALIEHIIDDLPLGAIMGFDHSKNVNPLLHHFTSVVRQSRMIERNHIDRQHYHVVQRKK